MPVRSSPYSYVDARGIRRDLSYKIERYYEEGMSEREAKEKVAWEAREADRAAKLEAAVRSMRDAGYTMGEVVDFVERVY